jgi:hypothetical protein
MIVYGNREVRLYEGFADRSRCGRLAHHIDQKRNSIRDRRDVTFETGADLAKTGKCQVTFPPLNSAKIAPV